MQKRKGLSIVAMLLAVMVILTSTPALTAHASAPNTGNLEVTMTDSTTGIPSDGAVFQLELSGSTMAFSQLGSGSYQYIGGSGITQLTLNNGKLTIADIPIGTYTLRQISSAAGKALDASPSRTITVSDQITSQAYFLQSPYGSTSGTVSGSTSGSTTTGTGGSIVATVIDSKTKTGISGATIKLYDSNNSLIETLTTDSYGDAFSGYLSPGTYFLRQTSTSGHYSIDSSRRTVNISSSVVAVEFTNAPQTGSMKIIAMNSKGERVSGVGFSLSSGNSKSVTLTTDGNGEAYSDSLAVNTYTVSCVSVPQGYVKSYETRTVYTGASGSDVYFIIYQQYYNVSFYATDENDNPADSVKIGVYNEDNGLIGTVTTDEDGYATYKNIGEGNYYAAIAKGQKVKGQQSRYKFTLAASNTKTLSIDLLVVPQTGTLEVTVLDGGENPVENAIVEIYSTKKKKLKTGATDEDGYYTLEDYPVGDYLILTKSTAGSSAKKKYTTVTISANATSEVTLRAGNGEKGTVIVYFKDIDTNKDIAPSRSYTDSVGVDYGAWLKTSKIDKKTFSGYTFMQADYPEKTALTSEVQEIVYWYSKNKV